jgi:phosphatidylglycerophosphatase A
MNQDAEEPSPPFDKLPSGLSLRVEDTAGAPSPISGEGETRANPAVAQHVVPWSAPSVFLATGFWAGRIPWAPGTWGALWGLPLSFAISMLPQIWAQAAAIVAINLIGIPLCTAAVRKFGGKKDPGAIVFDEIASMPIVFLFVPHAQVANPIILAAGFALHRLFDITKPPPARQLEALPDGLGIMADDWAAAAYAYLALHLLHWVGAFGSVWG